MSTTEPVSTTEPAAGMKEAKASDALVRAALSEVYDPEIGIDIVSLGLIYDTNIDDDGLLTIDMTLTTPYCPMGPIIETQAHAVCAPLPECVMSTSTWSGRHRGTPAPWPPKRPSSSSASTDLDAGDPVWHRVLNGARFHAR